MDSREFHNALADDASFLVAAHELKTPLSIIRQLSLTLNDKDIQLDEGEAKRISAQIDLTTERALRLVTDLTKVAKLEDAMFQLEPINTRRICNDIVNDMREVYKLHGRNLILKPTNYNRNQNLLALANYDLLRAILLNFSDNALYSSTEKANVEVSVQNVKNNIRISVRDYGESLPLSIWRSIKKQNCQPVAASSRPQSSGLGIYIAHNFAQAMNGEIGVIRHRNGNTFYVDLMPSEQLSLV